MSTETPPVVNEAPTLTKEQVAQAAETARQVLIREGTIAQEEAKRYGFLPADPIEPSELDHPGSIMSDARVVILMQQTAHKTKLAIVELIDNDIDQLHRKIEETQKLDDGAAKEAVSAHLHQILHLYSNLKARIAIV